MVAAPYKKHQNYVNKCVHIVHTQELNWVQIQSLIKKKNKTHHRTFHLKNDSDSDKNWQFTWKQQKFHNMGMACFDYNHL
jgi:hypothetical protein